MQFDFHGELFDVFFSDVLPDIFQYPFEVLAVVIQAVNFLVEIVPRILSPQSSIFEDEVSDIFGDIVVLEYYW